MGRTAFREIICKGIVGFIVTILVIGIVLDFWLLWDKDNQQLWDKVAGTVVVNDPGKQV